MRKLIIAVVVLLIPVAVAAGTKDVDLIDRPLVVGGTYTPADMTCILSPASNPCISSVNPSPSNEKLIHAATISLVAEAGFVCRAIVSVQDVIDSGGISHRLLQVFATETTPGVASISFPRPLLMEDRDQIDLNVSELNFQNDGCRAHTSVTIEELIP